MPANAEPCFLFSLHIIQWKVLLLSTGWLTLMRNIRLYQTWVLTTLLCVPLTCFQIRFKKGTWWQRQVLTIWVHNKYDMRMHTSTPKSFIHTYTRCFNPISFTLQIVLSAVKRILKAWLWQSRRKSNIWWRMEMEGTNPWIKGQDKGFCSNYSIVFNLTLLWH